MRRACGNMGRAERAGEGMWLAEEGLRARLGTSDAPYVPGKPRKSAPARDLLRPMRFIVYGGCLRVHLAQGLGRAERAGEGMWLAEEGLRARPGTRDAPYVPGKPQKSAPARDLLRAMRFIVYTCVQRCSPPRASFGLSLPCWCHTYVSRARSYACSWIGWSVPPPKCMVP